MAPGWPCSSAPSSSSSSSHTSTTFSCWWLGAWSKPFNLSHASSFPSFSASHLLELLYAPLWLAWLILTSRLNRDSTPVRLISPDFKSQVGAGKGRVVNPERSPSAAALILPWSSWLILSTPLAKKTQSFYHVSLGFCLGFRSCCPGLPAEKPLCTAELDTHTSSQWQESIYAFAMCPSRGRKTCPWSQLAKHEVAARWFTICLFEL